MITDEELAATMVAYPNYSASQLAEFLGVPVRNVEYRISRPGFAYKIAILRNSGFADAAIVGASGMTDCLSVLSEEMKSSENYSGERINAAKGYADIAIKCHQIAKQDIELLRLRAFIEENERRRSGVSFDLKEGEGDELAGNPTHRIAAEAGKEGVTVDHLDVSLVPTAGQGEALELKAESGPTIIDEKVASRIMGIVGKFTGER